MAKKNRLFIPLLLIILAFSLACSHENKQEKIQEDEKEQVVTSEFMARVKYDKNSENSGKLAVLAEKVKVVVENDLDEIIKESLSDNDFHNGYVLINMDNETDRYRFDDKSKIHVLEDTEFTQDEFLANVTVKDDYIIEISQIDEGDFKRQVYSYNPESKVINNGGHYVKYEGDVYYREYQNGSFYEVAVWHDFTLDPHGISKIVKLSPNGEKETIWEGPAYGNIFIYESIDQGPIILQSRFAGTESENDFYDLYSECFAIDLEGNMVYVSNSAEILYIDQERRLAVMEGRMGTIDVMDLENGKARELTDAYCNFLTYDQRDGIIFYENYENRAMTGDYDFQIDSININGGQQNSIFLLSYAGGQHLFEREELVNYYEFHAPRLSGDFLWIYMVGIEGTGDFIAENALIKIEKNGQGYERIDKPSELDWYGLNKVFNTSEDSPYRDELGTFKVYNLENIIDGEILLTPEELEALGHKGREEFEEKTSMSVENIEYVDGDLFFTVLEGKRVLLEDVGWRYAYTITKAATYKKNIASKEIELLSVY